MLSGKPLSKQLHGQLNKHVYLMLLFAPKKLVNFLFSSFRFGHVNLHRSGDRNARHDGDELRRRHRHRPPHPPSPLHLSADALPIRELAGQYHWDLFRN